jgi:hypothetical protein
MEDNFVSGRPAPMDDCAAAALRTIIKEAKNSDHE